ncbi:MAG: zinc-ribbon domain-containing protein [Nitrospirales bacterium]|nr:zinc-ribbon domain-containing protein [Nitrospirales bacterium]
MEITCQACSTKLTIPDEKVPQNAVFKVTCPKCQEKIQVSTKAEGAEAPTEAASAPAAPPPAPSPSVQDAATTESSMDQDFSEDMAPAEAAAEDDFVEDQKLALICFDQPKLQAAVKTALEGLGYTVHIPTKGEDAIQRLRQNKYDVVLLHEAYGGSVENNLVLQTLQPMAMPLRRHMCVGLVGKSFRTLDNMMAFVKSVSFVVAERELPKIKAITRQAVSGNDQFYRVFREALRDAGKT